MGSVFTTLLRLHAPISGDLSADMFTACEGRLIGKNIALFGSYGWGYGEWMRSWEARCNDDGANLSCESVICNEAPDDDALVACRELGASLA